MDERHWRTTRIRPILYALKVRFFFANSLKLHNRAGVFCLECFAPSEKSLTNSVPWIVIMPGKHVIERFWKAIIAKKADWMHATLPPLVNKYVVRTFLRLATLFVVAERSPKSIERIGKVIKKFHDGYSIIIIPSHPMARHHTLGMMYHCMKLSEQISGELPHVVLATDEITFVYVKLRVINKLIQRLYWFIGSLGGHIMLNRNDANSSFRAGIDIARLLRKQATVVMAGEGYPRHDSRKYVDIPNVVESFYARLSTKNLLPVATNKTTFVSQLVREIQRQIDREDKTAYRSGKLSDHVLESVRRQLLHYVPQEFSIDVDDTIDELLISWEERFGPLRAIDPVLGITVQPTHKALILPVVFSERSKRSLHIDVRDFFLIDGISYTEIRSSMREMEHIQRCNIALDLLTDQQHLRIMREICELTGVAYEPTYDDIFEEYHLGKLPYQVLWDIIEDRQKVCQDPVQRRHLEAYREYLRNFRLAAEIAILDDEDQAILKESIRCNLADLEHVIPSIRIRQAWKSHEASERIAMEG